ncbi:unnamed protein product [Cyclocybe aegerita]|uniref:Uncharacterized protein n=1 Tax=Cyclocybe aegerita TaxID=1973307 RepID=A0A8S0VXP2_CYCAE|nr:unnamed protein product [Cyclocybe aegerita]
MASVRPPDSIRPLPVPLSFGVHAIGGTERVNLVGFTVTRTRRLGIVDLHQGTGGVADPPVRDEVIFSLDASAPKLERDPVMERILSMHSRTRGSLEPSGEDYVNDFSFRRKQELNEILAKI